MIRRAVCSVAVGYWFPQGQQRCFDSLQEKGENATRLFWRDAYPPGSPTHEEVPYGFKVHALAEARRQGYDQALWLDASVWAVKPLIAIWDRLDAAGWYLEPDGHRVGEWINDHALDLLGLHRDAAMGMPLIEGKLVGLDFRNETACEFLDEWIELAATGAFNGLWTNAAGTESQDPRCQGHRHDIACGSPLAVQFGMGLQPEKLVWFPGDGVPPDHVELFAQGIGSW